MRRPSALIPKTELKRLERYFHGQIPDMDLELGVFSKKSHRREILPGSKKGLSRKKKFGFASSRSTLMGRYLLAKGKASSQSVQDVVRGMQKQSGVSIWVGLTTSNRSIKYIRDALITLMSAKQKPAAKKRRITNAFQAVVRNRITSGELGSNTSARVKSKGFNFLFVATGQVFKEIKARIRRIYKKRVK